MTEYSHAQPFADAYIFEVDAAQIAESQSRRSLTFSDRRGVHRLYADYHPGYLPVTLFVRDGDNLRARVVWSNPTLSYESDY